jgi:hypothetical protein|tara:strand:- start:498 stop:1106 length:609 start_codon:yes stop_codon:yes gene_type:complete
MKIDIHDIKFWMDAIRNSEDKERTLESFWDGQIKSKLWLIEALEKHKSIRNAEFVIHGGWNGVLACMMFNSELGCKHITSIDIDPKCKEIASTMNKRYEMEGKFESVTADMCEYEYTREPYFVINTSCEHITQEQYNTWLDKVPDGAQIILQSNNYFELDEHVNCSKDLKEFEWKSKLNVSEKAELELPKYTRYMLVGRKNK